MANLESKISSLSICDQRCAISDSMEPAYPSYRLKSSDAFVPPNPNEFDKA